VEWIGARRPKTLGVLALAKLARLPKAAGDNRQQRVNLSRCPLDPGYVAPMADLERDVGRQAAETV
jgi:hypothetical protein